MATKERQFVLTLNYKSDASEWDVISHDVIVAKSLTELLSKFNILIASLHGKLIEELKQQTGVTDDDIPF
jgi:hypothetical protein